LNATLIEPRVQDATLRPLPAPDFPANHDTIGDLTAVFKLLSDKSRLKIVLALAQNGPMHVTSLVALLRPQTQPAVSHHLALMRNNGLLGCDRCGKHNYYYIASKYLCELFEQFFRDKGDRDQAIRFDAFTLSFARREL
jgi:ArsR family transcriptional regulator, arsenate/arsenite/antimonite-responsive transcriptional repressor